MTVYLITYLPQDRKNTGDVLTLNSIRSAYESYYDSRGVETELVTEDHINSLASNYINHSQQKENHYKYLFTAEHGANAIKRLSDIIQPGSRHIEVIWAGHQIVSDINELPINIVYFPRFSSRTPGSLPKKSTLVTLPCVPTIPIKIPASTDTNTSVTYPPTLIWMLGGDARKENADSTNTSDNWLLLPALHPELVVEALKSTRILETRARVSVINGPRTGHIQRTTDTDSKLAMSIFNPLEPQTHTTTYHDHPLDLETNIDPVTESAKFALENLRRDDLEIEICHFWRTSDAFGKKISHSAYEEKMVEFLNNPNSILLLPGDSATELSKLIASPIYLEQRARIYVVLSDSMTEALVTWAFDLCSQGYFSCIDGRIDQQPIVIPADRSLNPMPKQIEKIIHQHLESQENNSTKTTSDSQKHHR